MLKFQPPPSPIQRALEITSWILLAPLTGHFCPAPAMRFWRFKVSPLETSQRFLSVNGVVDDLVYPMVLARLTVVPLIGERSPKKSPFSALQQAAFRPRFGQTLKPL